MLMTPIFDAAVIDASAINMRQLLQNTTAPLDSISPMRLRKLALSLSIPIKAQALYIADISGHCRHDRPLFRDGLPMPYYHATPTEAALLAQTLAAPRIAFHAPCFL